MNDNFDFDVCVIGAGVVGCAAAMMLGRYELSVCTVERAEDVCSGTSKANSAIVHAGYDAKPGTLKARMNVRGAAMIRELSRTLDFSYRENGSLVLCFDEKDMPKLNELYERGIKNGVEGLRILTGEEVRRLEPAVSDKAVAALLAPTAGIVCPFGMTVAFAENAAENGVEFRRLTTVTGVERRGEGFTVKTDGGDITSRFIVNAAGVYSDVIHNMICENKLHITPRRGEYVLLDKQTGDLVSHTVFQLPGAYGKGVLVTPTVHGNLLVGPSAEDCGDPEDTETTAEGTASVKQRALLSVPSVPYNMTITGFAGLRAHEDGDDFIIGESAPGFFDAAGIESPGLTSAPAIGEYIAELIAKKADARPRENAVTERRGIPRVSELPAEERSRLIKEDPAYGVIVCRCENVSEGEIVAAIRRNPGAVSLDGVKRRVRQGMGRCQAGFCTPAAAAILSRELGITMEEVRKNIPGSELIKERI